MKIINHILLNCILFTAGGIFTGLAQTDVTVDKQKSNQFDSITNLYAKGKINDTIYMQKMDSAANAVLDRGIYYETAEMAESFKQYEKIAWSKEDYEKYRKNYYFRLLNNVYMPGLWGATMYYAERLTKQSEKDGVPLPFIEPSLKMYFYGITNRDEKVIETYEKSRSNFEELLENLKRNPNEYYLGSIDALRIFSTVLTAYVAEKDTVNVEKTYRLASAVIENINKAPEASDRLRKQVKFYALQNDYLREWGLGNYENVLVVFDKLDQWIKSDKEYAEYTYGLIEGKVNMFLIMKQVDSASYYLDQYEKFPDFVANQKILISKYKSKLEFLKGNPEKAYDLLNEALEESFKASGKISEEMDDLLYAQTEAEHHRLAFEKSEAEKKQRNLWIIVISLTSFIIIVVVFITFRFKDMKRKQVIKNLNETADIQIALMEQFESSVRKEEQERISQDLHDDLAGTLAAIKNNIDWALTESVEGKEKEWLTRLQGMLESTFGYVRRKSHEMFEMAHVPDEGMFRQHILHLVQVAFPAEYYTFNVQIDDYALKDTSIELRSELIRVIQEAFTNIIKHAKATQVDLLIYKDADELFVVIKDNGTGLKNTQKQKTLGLQSMQNRLKKFRADFSIAGDEDGVEIIISIPEEEIVI